MWEELGDWDWHMYTIDTCIKEINNEKTLGMHRELCLMLCVNLNLKKEQKGGNICVCRADSFFLDSRNEYNIVKHYTLIKITFKKEETKTRAVKRLAWG